MLVSAPAASAVIWKKSVRHDAFEKVALCGIAVVASGAQPDTALLPALEQYVN